MTNTVTIQADHKGFARPRVLGDEYVVLGEVNITSFRTGSPASGTITANAVAVANTYTATGGTPFSDFAVGDVITVAGSHSNNNALLSRIVLVTPTVLTMTSVVNDDTGGGNEVFTHAGEKVLASSFGLSTINTVEVVQQEGSDQIFTVAGLSSDKTFFYLYCNNIGVAAAAGVPALAANSVTAGEVGKVTLRVTGLI